MDEQTFAMLHKGSVILIQTHYEVIDIDLRSHALTLRNLCNGEEFTGTDWWLYNMRQQGFTIKIID